MVYRPPKAEPAPHAIDRPNSLAMKFCRNVAIATPKIMVIFVIKSEYFLPIISDRERRIKVVNVPSTSSRVFPPTLSLDLSQMSP